MKMKKVFLLGGLVLAMSVSAAYAEEAVTETPAQQQSAGGLLSSLFGAGGPLADVLPDGIDIDAMVGIAEKQLGQAGREIAEVFGGIAEKAKSEWGDFSVDSLKEYAGSLLGQLTGGEEFDFSNLDIDAMVETKTNIRKTEEEYLIAHNAETLVPGDVQIVSNTSVNVYEDDLDQEEFRVLCVMIQGNYNMDEENQLWYVSGAEDVLLFRHQNDGEGGYPVADASFAEDGENYMFSIEAMCSEVGVSVDEFQESVTVTEVMRPLDLRGYLQAHPEIKGIEYDGAIMTAEELEEKLYENIDKAYGEPEEESLTEDAGSMDQEG